MLASTVEAVEGDRVVAARALAAATGAVVVLKGVRTVVADGVNITYNLGGSSALATGGTGDVLAGLIGGFLAQGLTPVRAAMLAVFVHGFAADRITGRRGDYGLVAGELVEEIPGAMNELAGLDEIVEDEAE